MRSSGERALRRKGHDVDVTLCADNPTRYALAMNRLPWLICTICFSACTNTPSSLPDAALDAPETTVPTDGTLSRDTGVVAFDAPPFHDTPLWDSAMADRGVGDAIDATGPVVTYEADIRPILQAHCSQCHAMDSGLLQFSRFYSVTQEPSTLCMGARVGECINLAAQNQQPEGMGCRTYVVRPFHREGWVCMAPPQIALIAAWVSGGMRER